MTTSGTFIDIRHLERGPKGDLNLDVARWAAARALLAAPEDELLLVERINTEVLAGNTAEVHRLVRWVTGQAQVLGVDLAAETVSACQRAMEGRTRPRAAR